MLNVLFSLLLFLSWNRKSNGMTDYRFSSVDVLTFLPCVLGGLLAVAHSRSDIEMSKPLSQITTAENVFSGCLTMQHSPLRTQSFRERLPKSACSQAPLSSSTFSETHMIISDQICMHQMIHYLAGPWTNLLPGCWKRKCGHFGPIYYVWGEQCLWRSRNLDI